MYIVTDRLFLKSIDQSSGRLVLQCEIASGFDPEYYTHFKRHEFFNANSQIIISISGRQVVDFLLGIRQRYLNNGIPFFIQQSSSTLIFFNYVPDGESNGMTDMDEVPYDALTIEKALNLI